MFLIEDVLSLINIRKKMVLPFYAFVFLKGIQIVKYKENQALKTNVQPSNPFNHKQAIISCQVSIDLYGYVLAQY